MDINPAYNCLLGRMWIHVSGAVTTILHQKRKFMVKGKLIIVFREEDLLVMHLSLFWYIEVGVEALETSFQALDIVNIVIMGEKDHVSSASSSFASLKSAKMKLERGNPEVWDDLLISLIRKTATN